MAPATNARIVSFGCNKTLLNLALSDCGGDDPHSKVTTEAIPHHLSCRRGGGGHHDKDQGGEPETGAAPRRRPGTGSVGLPSESAVAGKIESCYTLDGSIAE
ncbi:MAG: hypothetical protein Q6J44_08405, partial [Gloeomargarita sp. DG02_4_bins_56]